MSQRLAYIFVFLLVSPVVSLYYGLLSRSDEVKKWALIGFITIFGSVIILDESQDGYVVLQNVYDHYVDLSFKQFAHEAYLIFTFNPSSATQEEPFTHFLSYLTGGILGLPELFFPIVAFIYAYFFVGSILRLFRVFPKLKYSWLFFGFALAFLLWKNLEGINPVRSWTAMWVLVYACISYYETRHWKYALLMFVPPFIHIGFAIMAVPAWIVLVFGVHKWTYSILFAITFGLAGLNPASVTGALQQTTMGQEKVRDYYRDKKTTSDDTLKSLQSAPWYLKGKELGIHHWGIVLVAAILILSGAYFRDMTSLEASLFSVGLLTKALANASWFLYALANRSVLLAGVFILAALLLMWQRGYFARPGRGSVTQKMGLNVALLLFLPFFVFRFADLIYFVSIFMFFGPFVPWISAEANMSIREALGLLLGR
jgi:hypothetical protein